MVKPGQAGCPEIEEIAALADGRKTKSRDQLLRHIGECERCYELYTSALQYGIKSTEGASWFARPSVWMIAAGVVLAVMITNLWLRYTPDSPIPSAAVLARDLVAIQDSDQVLLRLDPGPAAGFIPSSSELRIAFLTGIRIVEAQVALNAGDSSAAGEFLIALRQELLSLEAGDEAISELDRDLGGAPTIAKTERLEQTLYRILPRAPLDLGKWTGIARLAVSFREATYFSPEYLNWIDRIVESEDLPPRVEVELRELSRIVRTTENSEDLPWSLLKLKLDTLAERFR